MQIEENISTIGISSAYERGLAAAGVSAFAGGAAVVAYFDPLKAGFFPACPMYSLTGYACPGCGLTRGFHALFHGDILSAIDFNAMVPIWALIFGYVTLSLAFTAVRGRGLPMWVTSPPVLWTFMALMLVFGILRNVPVYPFSLLFP